MNIKIEVLVEELDHHYEVEFTDVKLATEYLEKLEKKVEEDIKNCKELLESDDYDIKTCHETTPNRV